MLRREDELTWMDDPPTREYTISELATCHGVSCRTLRFYEQRGLLRPARRDGQRVFSRQDRIRLEVIMLAKRLGFSLAEIAALPASRSDTFDTPASIADLGLSKERIGAQVEHLSRERESVQRAIEELRAAALRVDGAGSGGQASR